MAGSRLRSRPVTPCVSDDVLTAFISGNASAREILEIETHVAECGTCAALCGIAAEPTKDRLAGRLSASSLQWSLPDIPRGTAVGRFVILDSIGRGAMGIVYSAYDPDLDRKVALKFLATSIDPSRMSREARAIARLAHPNVVTVHDVGTYDGTPFVAMEHVAGESLDRWLSRPRDWHAVVAVFVQAGVGLAAAHAAGVIHRDFKPSNVLVGEDGRTRVTDFGLARLEGRVEEPVTALAQQGGETSTQAGIRLGTPAYMAPEQRLNSSVDARADQYSFAMAMHEALFGRRPSGTLLGEAATSADVPDSLSSAIQRALSTKPDDRYPSMNELLDVLRASDPTDPRTVGDAALAEADRRNVRGKRIVRTVLLLTLIAIAIAAVVVMLVARHERDRARSAEHAARSAEHVADERLISELELAARTSYERGDIRSSLDAVVQLVARGSDSAIARIIVGTISWAWPLEQASLDGVRSVLPARSGRAVVELEREFLVVEGNGTVVARFPFTQDARGMDIDAAGDNVVILDPDLRVIPLATPDKSVTVKTVAADARWVSPKFIGPDTFAVRSDDSVLVVDRAGNVVRTIPTNGDRLLLLPLSRRLVVSSARAAKIVSLERGDAQELSTPLTLAVERPRDLALALVEPRGIRIVDAALRPIVSISTGGTAHRLAFSESGTILGAAIDDDIVLFDAASGQRLARIASHHDETFIFVGDSVWTGADGVIRRWSTKGTLEATMIAPDRVVEQLWKTDTGIGVQAGTRVAWFTRDGNRVKEMPVRCDVRRMSVTPSDVVDVVCSDATLRRWSGGTASTLATDLPVPEWVFIDPAGGYTVALRFTEIELISPNARRRAPLAIETVRSIVATPGAVFVATTNGLRRLDIATLQWSDIGHPELLITGMAWLGGTKDGVVAVVDGTSVVEIVDGVVGTPRALSRELVELRTSHDGKRLLVRDSQDRVHVLDRGTLRPVYGDLDSGAAKAMAVEPRGDRVALLTLDSRVRLVDSRSGAKLDLSLGVGSLVDVSFSADGTRLFVAGDHGVTDLPIPDEKRPLPTLAAELRCRYGSEPCTTIPVERPTSSSR
jgi:hypothetical protein